MRRIAWLTGVALAVLALASCGGGEDPPDQRGASGCTRPPDGSPVELRYRVEPAPAAQPEPGLTRETARALCERYRKLGLESVQVRASGTDELTLVVERDLEAQVTAASKPGEIHFYDWDANVLGGRGPDTPFAGARGLFEAVSAASRAAPRAERTDRPIDAPTDLSVAEADRRNDSAGERYYLFGADRQLIAGPASSGAALTRAAGPNRPATDRVLRVPQGIVVLEAERSPDQPASVRRFFVLEDDSELSGSDIEDPEASSDRQTQEPVVSFGFTDRGRAAFAAVTKRIAKRAAKAAGPPGASETERAAAFERFAIAVDDQITSRAAIDSLENPEGIDGREGAQISGIGSPDETRRLAALLDAVPLAAELIPLSPK